MTADQLWQTLVIVAAVAVTVFGASWRLSNVLEAVRGSVSALKLEMQQDVAQVRSDLALLRTSVDSKLALAEAQTKAELGALKNTTERLDEEVAELWQAQTAKTKKVVTKAAPRRRKGEA